MKTHIRRCHLFDYNIYYQNDMRWEVIRDEKWQQITSWQPARQQSRFLIIEALWIAVKGAANLSQVVADSHCNTPFHQLHSNCHTIDSAEVIIRIANVFTYVKWSLDIQSSWKVMVQFSKSKTIKRWALLIYLLLSRSLGTLSLIDNRGGGAFSIPAAVALMPNHEKGLKDCCWWCEVQHWARWVITILKFVKRSPKCSAMTEIQKLHKEI